MREDKRLPLDVKNQARELHFEVQSSRVFEQLYQGKNLSPLAESLALNTLRIHTDALSKLRIEVRERTPTGEMRIQVCAQDAPNVRVLVRNRNAQYRVYNTQGQLVHGATDFYTAVFHALTRDERFIDGERLRSWLIEKATPHRTTPDTGRATHPNAGRTRNPHTSGRRFHQYLTWRASGRTLCANLAATY